MDGQQLTNEKSKKAYQVLLIIGIVIASFNLRPAITSVGPILGIIREDVGLANWSAGLIASLPLFAFAIMSPIVSRIGAKFTNELALTMGLVVLVFGMLIRSTSMVFFIFLGTLIAGLGIAVCNVLIPGIIKDKFPLKVAIMTGIYSTSMGVFAGIASGFSVPLTTGLGLGWRLSLLVWALPALIGIFIWMYIVKRGKVDRKLDTDNFVSRAPNNRIWKSSVAWQMAMFMALQSFLFYVTISWLPAILHDNGLSLSSSGWMLSYMQFVGLPSSFIVPMIAGRMKSQQAITAILGCGMIVGFIGLLLGDSFMMMVISVTIIGIALNGNFALALTFLGLRARTAQDASDLSGMSQSLGYLFSAIGPMVIGLLYDVTNTWTLSIYTLIGATVLLILFGFGIGRDRYVLD